MGDSGPTSCQDKKLRSLFQTGDVSLLPSGHDAWVLSDEPAIVVGFQRMIDYSKAA